MPPDPLRDAGLICEMPRVSGVMRVIATVKTAKSNEFQKLVSTGGATVGRGTEGSARSETNTPKIERVTIKLNPIYAYPKTTQEILDFSEVDILGWLSSEVILRNCRHVRQHRRG